MAGARNRGKSRSKCDTVQRRDTIATAFVLVAFCVAVFAGCRPADLASDADSDRTTEAVGMPSDSASSASRDGGEHPEVASLDLTVLPQDIARSLELTRLAMISIEARRFDEALGALDTAIALHPDNYDAHYRKMLIFDQRGIERWQAGRFDAAYRDLARGGEIAKKLVEVVDDLSAEAMPWIRQALYNGACANAQLGHPEEALELLGLALANGYDDFAKVRDDPDLDPLRDRPQFQRLLDEYEIR